MRVAPDRSGDIALDPVDRRIVAATQAGLPLTARPYHAVAQDLGLPAAEVMRRITRMLETGAIRRIGAVPNHYALGWTANGMSVWDLADAEAGAAGRLLGAADHIAAIPDAAAGDTPPLFT